MLLAPPTNQPPPEQDATEMATALKDRCPSKIDIGPVYNVDPQRRAAYQGMSVHCGCLLVPAGAWVRRAAASPDAAAGAWLPPQEARLGEAGLSTAPAPTLHAGSGQGFSPVERELVFDIDLTDYDDVRTCGTGGHICGKCWPLMAAAIKVGAARLVLKKKQKKAACGILLAACLCICGRPGCSRRHVCLTATGHQAAVQG